MRAKTSPIPSGRVRSWPLGVVLLGGLLCGCGGGGPVIKGTVTLDGAPLADAQVRFLKEEAGKPAETASCTTGPDGSFQVKPRSRGGMTLQPGKYNVFIAKMVDKKGNVPPADDPARDPGQMEAAGLLHDALRNRYNDPAFPQFKAEIKPGTNNLPPFELKGK
jgi:hypothetical protein